MSQTLLGRDVLQRVVAHLIFENRLPHLFALLSEVESNNRTYSSAPEEYKWLDQVDSGVWATDTPERAQNATPVTIQLKDPSFFPH